LNILKVFAGSQITIEVPFGYAHRDQLLDFMKSKFPDAEFSIVHCEVPHPTVSEAFVRHDSTAEAAQTAAAAPGQDSEAILLKTSEALSEFTKTKG
jgi:hypothetical protein